jgi:Kef-type K+ transport system membrane component KefB
MTKVLAYSLLLLAGLVGSQLLPALGAAEESVRTGVRLATTCLLGFIMIHVGYEFVLDRTRLRSYGVDYGVAATAAAFPWIFCTLYFLAVLMPPGAFASLDAWTAALLAGRFAAPTSAGVLFSMLAAAGLSATWVFRKARVLAIFDDLDTILLMIPLKMLIVGLAWQLGVVVAVMAVLIWVAWRFMRRLRAPVTWPWVLGYAAGMVLVAEIIHTTSLHLDDVVPIHLEILLPAFVLGCVLAHPREGEAHALESAGEARAATVVSGAFMVLVGLSMPALGLSGELGLASLVGHTLVITLLANLGKMFPVFCYRGEATLKERLAVCIAMWPRGEVGAGVLVVSLGYGIGGPMIPVAVLSLALNLALTGIFILAVKRLLADAERERALVGSRAAA